MGFLTVEMDLMKMTVPVTHLPPASSISSNAPTLVALQCQPIVISLMTVEMDQMKGIVIEGCVACQVSTDVSTDSAFLPTRDVIF